MRAGKSLQSFQEIVAEVGHLRLRGVLLRWKGVVRHQQVLSWIAEIDIAQLLKAAQQQAGCGEEDESDGNLCDDEDGAEARMSSFGLFRCELPP